MLFGDILVSSDWGAFRSMVVEISRGSARHRGRLAASAPICLRPISEPRSSFASLFWAFLAGSVVTFALGLWWLLNLED